MGGDGMGGLAIAIFIACVLMIAVPAAIGFFVGRAITKNKRARILWSLGIAVLGIVGGVLAVFATFYESTWSPPNRAILNVPPDFKHEWIVLLEKHDTQNSIPWRGGYLPFTSKSAEVSVPPNGIVVVKSINEACCGYGQMHLFDGTLLDMRVGPTAKELGYRAYLAVRVGKANQPVASEPSLPLLDFEDPSQFSAFLKTRGVLP